MRKDVPAIAIAIARARAMRHQPTDAEKRLWALLRGQRLHDLKFRRQHPVGPYIADFVCLSESLIIEADGRQHGEGATKRDAWLNGQGFRILRFANEEILENREGVIATIASACGLPW